MWILAMAVAFGAPAERPVTVALGAGMVAGPPSVGVFGAGRIRLNLSRWALELGNREALVSRDGRIVGAIQASARWLPVNGLALRLGLSHHHEVPLDLARAHPIGAVLGSLPEIRHRSGLELGVGVERPLPWGGPTGRSRGVMELSAAAFPDPQGPWLYVFLETGIAFDLGRRRG